MACFSSVCQFSDDHGLLVCSSLSENSRPSVWATGKSHKWYPERPRARRTTTRIIANDRGHLLPGIHRSDHTPWGRYLGTWDLPKRITRKLGRLSTATHDKYLNKRDYCPIFCDIEFI
ncbi:unnamed protein product [Timema podura]|uniref:Cilia- and flagella-associated protein 126 n=1 Tax=Timema podura TaxID=61482 RepID=A0ABN7PD59_TIMPD|nr:unnamed protein product [Timema podura]